MNNLNNCKIFCLCSYFEIELAHISIDDPHILNNLGANPLLDAELEEYLVDEGIEELNK
jgi:hypothetical protein